MLNFLRKLFSTGSVRENIDQTNLSYQMQNAKFEDELIDMRFSNVGTYHAGSRTRMKVSK